MCRQSEQQRKGEHTYASSDLLLEPPIRKLIHQLVQFSPPCILEHQKDPPFVVKVAVQAQDVRMSKIHLDLDLSAQLLFHLVLHQFALVHALERDDVAFVGPASGAHHVDTAELALAERTAHFKVVHGPGACWRMRFVRIGRREGERIELHGAAPTARFVAFQAAIVSAKIDGAMSCGRGSTGGEGSLLLLGRASVDRLLGRLL